MCHSSNKRCSNRAMLSLIDYVGCVLKKNKRQRQQATVGIDLSYTPCGSVGDHTTFHGLLFKIRDEAGQQREGTGWPATSLLATSTF